MPHRLLTAARRWPQSRAMGEPIRIAKGILVPEGGIEWRAVRSSGPGGQNVNKVASKVELRVRLDSVSGLTAPARARLEAFAAGRLDADGRLLVTSQRTRDQHRNLCRTRHFDGFLIIRTTRRT